MERKGLAMTHMRIAAYRITSGTAQEVADLARDGMLPIFRQQPGFVGYEVVDAGNGTVLSVSRWQSAEQAVAATAKAADWVRENLAARVQLQASYVGEALLSTA